jgi:hypothetical protein
MEPINEQPRDYTEEMAELMNQVSKDKQEAVAAHLLGTIQGVLLAQDIQNQKTA